MCTGNQCRSPIAEALLRDRLARTGVEAIVSSAGLLEDGVPASAHGVTVLGRRGLDLSGHRSRTMRADMLRDADLVLGMARMHVREATVLDPAVFRRSFTLKELVRRGEDVGPRRHGEELTSWLARVGEGRRPTDLLGQWSDDDIEDPIGGPVTAYETTAAELDGLLARLVALLWPPAAERSA